jgi:putative transposase
MPVKRKIPYSNGHFFITFTCYNWLPLIEHTNSYDLVYNWFDYLKKQGHFITGYVMMPNPRLIGRAGHTRNHRFH